MGWLPSYQDNGKLLQILRKSESALILRLAQKPTILIRNFCSFDKYSMSVRTRLCAVHFDIYIGVSYEA